MTGPSLKTYGYNNRSIASTHGGSLVYELDSFRPNILAVHGLPPATIHLDDCSLDRQHGPTKFAANWTEMVNEIYTGSAQHGITLARISETTPCETWSVALRRRRPQRPPSNELPMQGSEVNLDSPRPNA